MISSSALPSPNSATTPSVMHSHLTAAPSPSSISSVRRHSLGIGRANKRKQSHPMRSPFPSDIHADNSANPSSDDSPLGNCRRVSLTTDRAFCFSFLDDYSRNQQAYVQALHGPSSKTNSSVAAASAAAAAAANNNNIPSRPSSAATQAHWTPGPNDDASSGSPSEADDSVPLLSRKRIRQEPTVNTASVTVTTSGIDQNTDGHNIANSASAALENADDFMSLVPPHIRSTVKWAKAEPINISDKPYFSKLAPAEQHCCSILRIAPEQYLTIKRTLIREGRTRQPGTFKKRDAQRLCRIDVNKTSKIYEWYVKIGWLPDSNGHSHLT